MSASHYASAPLVAGHDVYTVACMGWKGVRNGQLFVRAAAAGFDVLITTDSSIEDQQNRSALPAPLIVLDTPSNDLSDLLPLIPALLAALCVLTPRTVSHVP